MVLVGGHNARPEELQVGERRAQCANLLSIAETPSGEERGHICLRPENDGRIHPHSPNPPQSFLLSGTTLWNFIAGVTKNVRSSERQTYLSIQKCIQRDWERLR